MNCSRCNGEGGGFTVNDRVIPRDCSHCLAERCIINGRYKDDDGSIYEASGNVLAFVDLKGAKKLCECFANGHKNEKKTKSEPSKPFEDALDKARSLQKKIQEKDVDSQQILLDRYEQHTNPERYDYKKSKEEGKPNDE